MVWSHNALIEVKRSVWWTYDERSLQESTIAERSYISSMVKCEHTSGTYFNVIHRTYDYVKLRSYELRSSTFLT